MHVRHETHCQTRRGTHCPVRSFSPLSVANITKGRRRGEHATGLPGICASSTQHLLWQCVLPEGCRSLRLWFCRADRWCALAPGRARAAAETFFQRLFYPRAASPPLQGRQVVRLQHQARHVLLQRPRRHAAGGFQLPQKRRQQRYLLQQGFAFPIMPRDHGKTVSRHLLDLLRAPHCRHCWSAASMLPPPPAAAACTKGYLQWRAATSGHAQKHIMAGHLD